jgi:hypothetical protein
MIAIPARKPKSTFCNIVAAEIESTSPETTSAANPN